MKYTCKLINEYISPCMQEKDLLEYCEILGFNPVVISNDTEDTIFELEIPANRGELLSLLGLTRELVPFAGGSIVCPDINFKEKVSNPVQIKIEDTKHCAYYSCRPVFDVCIKKAEHDFRENLEKLGFRPAHNAVDIANFVMAETGQPLHIFDLDKIEGPVEVRMGRAGEKIVTIDGLERDADEGVLVIADSKKVIAIAGIMGGKNTEVTSDTKNILIESAVFNPVTVRRGSKKLGLVTDASIRFEKGIVPDTSLLGLNRASFLIESFCNGKVGPASCKKEDSAQVREKIVFHPDSLEQTLGLRIEESSVEKILSDLNFCFEKGENDEYLISPPPYRSDIRANIDIVEEIARYNKYSSIPVEMPSFSLLPTNSSDEVKKMEKMRSILSNFRFVEVLNLGIEDDKKAFSSGMDAVSIENPLTSNMGFLRTSLVPELLENIQLNLNNIPFFDLFEIGKVYYYEGKEIIEENRIALVSVNGGDFFELKGRVEGFLNECGIKGIVYKNGVNSFSDNSENLVLLNGGIAIGNIFVLSDKICREYSLKNADIYIAELFLGKFAGEIDFARYYKELPKYPPSRRDYSFIFPEKIIWEDVKGEVLSLNLPVESIDFFDAYKGENVPAGNISLSFSVVFRDSSKTLESDEIDEFSMRIIDRIYKKINGRIRDEKSGN